MKRTVGNAAADGLFFAGAVLLFFGCIASSFRSAKTLEPGQVSLSTGYMEGINVETAGKAHSRFISAEGRISPGRQVDIGLMHTLDITRDNDALCSTVWGDVRVQLCNTSNEPQRFTFSTGLIKGYAYHPDVVVPHITSLPVVLSFAVSDVFTPILLYRHEFISEEIFPTKSDELSNSRSFLAVGAEITLVKPDPTRWIPRLGVSIGTYNSLVGGAGDRGVTLEAGFSIDTPVR